MIFINGVHMNFLKKSLSFFVLLVCLGVVQSFGMGNNNARAGLFDRIAQLGRGAVDVTTFVGRDLLAPAAKTVVSAGSAVASATAGAAASAVDNINNADEKKLMKYQADLKKLEFVIGEYAYALGKPREYGRVLYDRGSRVIPDPYEVTGGGVLKPLGWGVIGYSDTVYTNEHGYREWIGNDYSQTVISDLKADMEVGKDRLNREIKKLEKIIEAKNERELEDVKNGKGGVFAEAALGVAAEMKELVQKREESKGRAMVARQYSKAIVDMISSPKNIAMFVAAIIVLIIVYKGASFAQSWAEKNFGRPSLVLEDDNKTLKERLLQSLKSAFSDEDEDEEKDILSDVVLSDEMLENIKTYADDICQNRELGLPYQNALFYGPPGTGKTLVAKLIARGANVHYVLTSGANISQFRNGQAVAELNKIFDYAEVRYKKSGVPTLIFFDEADCFRDRALQDKDGVDTVNAFLSRTNGCNDAYIVVLATNAAEDVDTAVLSRTPKKFKFSLPAENERYKMLVKKIEKFILNDVRTYKNADGDEVEASLIIDSVLDDTFWRKIANKIEGFSGRDIEMAVQEMRTRAYRSGVNILTQAIVDHVIKDSMETVAADKRKAEYQRKKFEKEKGMQKYDDSTDFKPIDAPAAG